MRTALTAETRLRRWHEGIDRYHLNERLAEILRFVEPDERRRHQQLGRWNTALDTDDGAIDRIARWIAQQIPEYDGEALATLEAHWTYLVKNNDRMRYATLRAPACRVEAAPPKEPASRLSPCVPSGAGNAGMPMASPPP